MEYQWFNLRSNDVYDVNNFINSLRIFNVQWFEMFSYIVNVNWILNKNKNCGIGKIGIGMAFLLKNVSSSHVVVEDKKWKIRYKKNGVLCAKTLGSKTSNVGQEIVPQRCYSGLHRTYIFFYQHANTDGQYFVFDIFLFVCDQLRFNSSKKGEKCVFFFCSFLSSLDYWPGYIMKFDWIFEVPSNCCTGFL